MSQPVFPVLIAGLATMPIGFLWFSPALFGRQWMEMSKISAKAKHDGMVAPFMLSLLSGIAIAAVLVILMDAVGSHTFRTAAMLGTLMWFAFHFLPEYTLHLFDRRPLALLLINTGYQAANILLIALILTVWQ